MARIVRFYRTGGPDELRIEEGGVREVPLPLVLLSPEEARPPPPEAAASAAPAPAQPPVPVAFRGIPAGSVGDVEVLGVTVPAGDGEEVTFQECLAPKGASLEADWRRVRSAVAVLGPDLASDPVPVPDSGAAVFALRPAGLLLAAPDRILPGGMGRLTLRLPGGRPIPVHRDGGTDFTGSVVEVEPGMLLGPLPEGEWRFEVRLGRVRLPDAVAAARAGRIDVLRIPTRGE